MKVKQVCIYRAMHIRASPRFSFGQASIHLALRLQQVMAY